MTAFRLVLTRGDSSGNDPKESFIEVESVARHLMVFERKTVKVRVLTYYEIEERFREILTELECRPLDEESIVEKGGELLFALGVCISQMKAPNSTAYPEKGKHLAILEKASTAITYKINTCTVEEITRQVNAAYLAFGVQ